MLDNSQHDITLSASDAVHAPRQPGTLRLLIRTAQSRRQLRDMEPRMLDDIGLSRSEALAEAARAPWNNGHRARSGRFQAGISFDPLQALWRLLGGGLLARRPPG